jgi:hypothetical protein
MIPFIIVLKDRMRGQLIGDEHLDETAVQCADQRQYLVGAAGNRNGQGVRAQVVEGDAYDALIEGTGNLRAVDVEKAGADIADAARLGEPLEVLSLEDAAAGEDQVAGERANPEQVHVGGVGHVERLVDRGVGVLQFLHGAEPEDSRRVHEEDLGSQGIGGGACHLVEIDLHGLVAYVAHGLHDADVGYLRRMEPAEHLAKRPAGADTDAQPGADDLLEGIGAGAGDGLAQGFRLQVEDRHDNRFLQRGKAHFQGKFHRCGALVGGYHPHLDNVQFLGFFEGAGDLRAGEAKAFGDLVLVVVLFIICTGDLDQPLFAGPLGLAGLSCPFAWSVYEIPLRCNYVHTISCMHTI